MANEDKCFTRLYHSLLTVAGHVVCLLADYKLSVCRCFVLSQWKRLGFILWSLFISYNFWCYSQHMLHIGQEMWQQTSTRLLWVSIMLLGALKNIVLWVDDTSRGKHVADRNLLWDSCGSQAQIQKQSYFLSCVPPHQRKTAPIATTPNLVWIQPHTT